MLNGRCIADAKGLVHVEIVDGTTVAWGWVHILIHICMTAAWGQVHILVGKRQVSHCELKC